MSSKKPRKSTKRKVETPILAPEDLVSNMPFVSVIVEPLAEKVFKPAPGVKEQKVYTVRLEHHHTGTLFDEEPRLHERICVRLTDGKSYYGSVQSIEGEYFFISDDYAVCKSHREICNYYYAPEIVH